jgi:hypothetical protein
MHQSEERWGPLRLQYAIVMAQLHISHALSPRRMNTNIGTKVHGASTEGRVEVPSS